MMWKICKLKTASITLFWSSSFLNFCYTGIANFLAFTSGLKKLTLLYGVFLLLFRAKDINTLQAYADLYWRQQEQIKSKPVSVVYVDRSFFCRCLFAFHLYACCLYSPKYLSPLLTTKLFLSSRWGSSNGAGIHSNP